MNFLFPERGLEGEDHMVDDDGGEREGSGLEQSRSSSHPMLFQHAALNLKVRGRGCLRQVVYKQSLTALCPIQPTECV